MATCQHSRKQAKYYGAKEGVYLCALSGNVVVGYYGPCKDCTEYGCRDGESGMCAHRSPKI